MVKRLAIAAILAAAVAAAVAVGLVPGRSATVSPPRGGISARVRLERAALFGDIVRGTVDVLVDRRVVDPGSVHLDARFGHWVASSPASSRHDVGDVTQLSLEVSLACVAVECLPPDPTRRGRMLVRFPTAMLGYDRVHGGSGRLAVTWPTIELASRMTAYDMAHLNPLDQPPFRATEAPMPPSYRISPTLLLWLLCAVGALLLAAAGLLVVRFARRPAPVAEPEPPPPAHVVELSPLERALLLLERAREHGGVPEQRRALEHLAGELRRSGERDLAGSATSLAWAERPPAHEETRVLAAAVQRRISANGNGHGAD